MSSHPAIQSILQKLNEPEFVTGLVTGVAIAIVLTVLSRLFSGSGKQAKATKAKEQSSSRQPFVHVEKHDSQDFTLFEHDIIPAQEALKRSRDFAELMDSRRTIRHYRPDPVPMEVIENCIRTAGTAPSGAHRQPWTFCVITDPEIKRKMREIVEEEEEKNWNGRMRESWKADIRYTIKSLHSDSNVQKPYLTEAPAVVAVFQQKWSFNKEGKKLDHYYVQLSAALSAGFFIAALHNANLCCLTSTPEGSSKKMRQLLGRPDTEKLILLLPVGYAAEGAQIPRRTPEERRKPLADIMTVH